MITSVFTVICACGVKPENESVVTETEIKDQSTETVEETETKPRMNKMEVPVNQIY